MKNDPCAIARLLPHPERLPELTLEEWDTVVRQAQRAQVAARLGAVLDERNLLAAIPEQPRRHLLNTLLLANRQQDMVRWEVQRLADQLRTIGVPLILLKGSAYVMTGLPCARGRLFSDVDIMVPRSALEDVEKRLTRFGWMPTHANAYDQRYYREWMHELPPLRHGRRGTVLDIHHTILPPTARLKPDPAKLLRDARPLGDLDDVYVLCPEDMVLHSATHLFHDGELEHGLRDLADLMDLTRRFTASHPDFPESLVARAREMDLVPPLFYALRYLRTVLGVRELEDAERALAPQGPAPLLRPAMDALFGRALRPDHPTCSDWLTPAARWLLYVRSHWLRMPLRLLVPHLVRKSLRRAHQD